MHPTPIRHHGGTAVTGARFPHLDLADGWLPAAVIAGPDWTCSWAEGGPLDAPEYVPQGGAEALTFGAERVVFFTRQREGV
jgi:hypothetical protein